MTIDGLTARWGAALGKGLKAEDSLWSGLTDSMIGLPMGITAENLAEQYNISREDCDAFALRSQQNWAVANERGHYTAEIEPIEIKGKKGKVMMTADEHPRPSTTLADLNKLKPVFKPDGGRVTAGSASGICDGAASLVLASESSCKSNNLTPLSRVVAWSRVGCEPTVMGIGPVGAIEAIFRATNLTAADIDLIEINEAFAAQFIACEKALKLDREKVNVCGGAIALGHPLGASGARITAHLAHALKRTGGKYGLGAACIGGGQGIAVLIENVK
jgi:acetyl-CoA acyltransferase 2